MTSNMQNAQDSSLDRSAVPTPVNTNDRNKTSGQPAQQEESATEHPKPRRISQEEAQAIRPEHPDPDDPVSP